MFSSPVTGRNAKVWFGAEAREHYEVQILRRAKETWDTAGLSNPGAAVEAADRLAEYVAAFESLRDSCP